MDKSKINSVLLEVLDELQQAIIFTSRQDDIIWSNSSAKNYFDLEQIQKIMVRKDTIRDYYEDNEKSFVLALPTKLGFPVRFSAIYCPGFQILVSSIVGRSDLQDIRESMVRMIKTGLMTHADSLVNISDTLRLQLQAGGISSRSELIKQLNSICLQGEKLQANWQDTQNLLESIEFDQDKVDRINIKVLTDLLVRQLNRDGVSISSRYFNLEYGVIYSNAGVLLSTLKQLISGSFAEEAGDRDVTLNVHQSLDYIVWEWSTEIAEAEHALRPLLIWQFLGGDFQINNREYISHSSLRMRCGGSAPSLNSDLALWSEKEIFKLIS